MDVIQTLELEVAKLTSGNQLYETYNPIWKYLLVSYTGGEEYRRAAHLTRYQLETDAEYTARLRATPLENHCASVISVYNSFLFREEPDREFGSLSAFPELEDFLNDADMDGRNLNAFMKDVATWSSVFGHSWIIVAKPNVGAQTRADEQAQGVRPYVNLLTPLVVLDWRWERQTSGRYELSYFKYLEDVNGNVRTVKEWTKETIRTVVVNIEDNVINEDVLEINQLGIIPAVCAYNGRSTVRGIGISDISDIADQQRFIYNALSEVEASIRINTHPSLVATPETRVGTGSGALIHMPDNLDPGLKPYLLEFTGASISSIYDSIKHAIGSIDKMANTGAVRATESRTLSGVAMETEFSLLNARLSEKADNLELAEEQMWRIWCKYMNAYFEVEIDYPGSFNIRDTSKEIEQLRIAKDTATDPAVLRKIDEHILDWMDEEKEYLPFIDPNPMPGRTYPDGEPIADSLPVAYQPATNPDVPAGQNCANCEYFKPGELYCTKFDAPVRAVFWCAKWEPTEENEYSIMTAEIMAQIQEMIMTGMTNAEIMTALPGITVEDIVAAAAQAARNNN
jgi:hypothetical protein